jgi:uncharacterized membrane protein (DUF2068 family)
VKFVGLKLVALFEGAKGALVLLAGGGLLLLIHRDLHQVAASLIVHFHLNPANTYPKIFIDLADHINDAKLWGMAGAATIYASVRFIEAIGLWLERNWAKWFGFLSGAMYLPLEIYELSRGVTWQKSTVFIVNALIVLYLLYVLLRRQMTGHVPR